MLRRSVNEPRSDPDAVERMKRQIGSGLRREATDPDAIAGRVWAETAFPGHPYGRPSSGTLDSVAALSPDDLVALHGRLFARKDLKISAVGAIGPERLAALLDSVFGKLPEAGDLVAVADTALSPEGERKSIALDVPQTSIRLGLPALKRDDPDFIPAFVMNHILG
ncbi:unnamed protein product, partial [Scytosiphon promiscuus]